ncbi:MAG TPA: peptidylprolyl isomerase [Vicinamibacterales bacterium]|nr:peptidylprolyl isomerase [Vicinamibacterales bacterium]
MRRTALVITIALVSAVLHASDRLAQTTGSRRLPVLAIEEARAPAAGDIDALLQAARSGTEDLQAAAVRALGRLERRDLLTHLLPFLQAKSRAVQEEAANAVAQAFRGEPLPDVPAGRQVRMALEALLAAPPSGAVYRSIGRLPYETVDQVRAAEAALRKGIGVGHAGAARGLESMARLHRRVATIEPETTQTLRALAARTERTYPAEARRNAMAALVAAQGADAATVEAVLRDEDPEIRRLAALVLAGAGSPVSPADRLELLETALQDRSHLVRIEAVRAWAARAKDAGCTPLTDALGDTSLHVVLAALDALGDQCKDDDTTTVLVTSEARTPPAQGSWHREAHALVALAKRAPDRAAIAMSSFAMHPVWQVRMYAARAAAQMNDVATLARLAGDEDDNVAAAALSALRQLAGADSDAAFIAALNRRTRIIGRNTPVRPYDLLRTAAIELKGAQPDPALLDALVRALQRVTEERCETSRDVRLALLERIGEFGSAARESALTPLLGDIDPRVAAAAAAVLEKWTGRRPAIEPQKRQAFRPDARTLDEQTFVRVALDTGREFWIAFHADQAPLSKARFLSLVRARYYDGLTFHRVVPNFVIQGGSPGANEYCGDCPYWRDEVGLLMHTRGTIGISTRGRDTGDAQIFVNLVDSPRLDHTYTVFAHVCEGMDAVDAIQEGARMRTVAVASPPAACLRVP